MNAIQFSKGGAPSDAPDSMGSEDVIEVLLGISRGPIKGLRNGPKSFMFDKTALVDVNNTPNFRDFQLDTWPGSPLGHTVKLALGGFSSPVVVGQTLAPNIAVTRTGAQVGIDAADFRIVIGALFRSSDKGLRPTPLELKFEYKTVSQLTWSPAWVSTLGTDLSAEMVGTGGDQTFQINSVRDVLSSFFGDRPTQTTTSTPPANPTATPLAWDSSLHSWNTGTVSWESVPTTSYPGYVTFTDPASGEVRRVYDQQTVTTPDDARVGDLWRFDGSKLLIWNGMAWVEGYSAAVQPPAIVSTSGVWSMNDKVTSTTPKDIRIFFPPTTELMQYRITQLTTPSDSATITIAWESIQEIKRSAMTFKGTAMARLIGKASDQFTALPALTGDYDGRIIRVPSNYDAVTRTYTGVWDGVYQMAFSNNPAWVFLDFVEDDDYGLSSLYPHVCNADKIYEWAQWCDVMVPRPDGTLRPRWTFNDYIQEPREAREMAQYIAGAAGARYVDDGNGIVDIIIDRDQDAVCLFTLESVGEDGFSYSYTDPQTRANEIIVSFVNPDLEWSEDKRIVRNEESIADVGRIPLPFIAVACTDVDEATARARQRLITGLTEKEFVTFKTNRKGRYLSEWDTILVADADMGRGISGRIQSVLGPQSVSLRDPVSFEIGITYVASFDTVNPDYPATSTIPYRIERRTITNGPGATSTLTFASDLPELPEYANFSIEAAGILGTPKPYKITKIEIPDGSADQLTITAMEVNRNKWAYIDTAEFFEPPAYSAFAAGNVAPISNLRVVPSVKQIGAGSMRVLTLAWDRPSSAWVRRYRVVHSVDSVVINSVETDQLTIDFERVDVGVHRWTVFAIDIEGRDSVPLSLAYEVVGEVRPVGTAGNFRMLDETSSSVFSSISPRFAWDAGDLDPNFSYYEMEIVDPGTGTRRRIEALGTEVEWSYDWEKQKEDNAGAPPRSFEARLRRVDQYGNRSNPIAASVSNPTPAAPAGLTVTPTLGGFNVTVTPPTERDVMGTLIWVTGTTGFDPLVVPPAYDGDQQSFYVPAAAGDARFARAAFYDRYGKTPAGLNISAEATGTVPYVEAVDLSASLVASMAADTALAVAAEAAARLAADTLETTNRAAAFVAEAAARAAAIGVEATERADAILAEATARGAAITTVTTNYQADDDVLASNIATVSSNLTSETSARTAAITAETTARSTAISAEATARETLATQMRGAYTGGDASLVTSGLVFSERNARVAADNSLAASIVLLSAGASEQFDPLSIWYFDSTIEGWTGNGTPTIVSGYLRPADHASAAYVISPGGLDGAASTYTQLKLRVHKTGAPTFNGYVWWRAPGDTTWDTGRRTALVAPSYDANGIGVITVSPTWTGTIDKIRIDLSDAQTATDAFEIDWVSIGRPSPGASTASLYAEQSARATADSGLATDILTLTGVVNGNTAAIAAESTARATGDSAEVSARQALSVKLTGLSDPLAATLAGLSAGLIYEERSARATSDGVITASVAALTTTVNGNTAAITAEATARSTADAASATRIDGLFASTGVMNGYSLDPSHQAWPIANALPNNVTTSGTAPTTTRITTGMLYGEKALKGACTAVASSGYLRAAAAMKPASVNVNNYVVCEWEITLDAGDLKRAGFEYRINYTTGYKRATVHLFDQHATPTVGKTYRGSKLVILTDVGSSGSVVDQTDYEWLNNSTLFTTQTNSAKTLSFQRVSWRSATDEEVAAGVTLPVVSAALTAEQTARADGDSANATSIATVSAVANAKNKTFSQTTAPGSGMVAGDLWFDSDDSNKAYRYNGSTWVLTADARVAANAAAITAEQTARANGDSANATSIATLSTTVGGHTSSITTNAAAISNINGRLSATWGVTLNVDNRVSGIKLFTEAGGSTSLSYFDVLADKFRVFNGTSDVPVFEVSGGAAYIAGDRVRTKSLLDGAVTSVISAESSSIQLLTMDYEEYMTLRWTPPPAYFAGETGKIRIRVDWGVLLKGGTNQTNVASLFVEAVGPILPPVAPYTAGPWLGTSAISVVQPPNLKTMSVAWTNVGDVWNIGAVIEYLDIKLYGKFGSNSAPPSITGGFIVVTELLK